MLGTPHTEPSDYELFGLRLRSDISLPELFPAPREGAPDVVIRVGELGEPPGEPGLTATEDALLLTVAGVGRYRIRDGEEIVVDVTPGVPERNVRLYLLGSAMGALLHQRGLLPLHANAIEIDGQAVAFMGESGAGKSTVAAWFHDRGFRVIADDVCVVGFDEAGRAHATPGLPRLRLWKESLEASGRDSADYQRAWEGSESWDKFDVPLRQPAVVDEDRVLKVIYLLKTAEQLEIQPLIGARAAQALIENTYRGRAVQAAAGPRLHWEACMRVAEGVPLFEFRRPRGLARLEQDMSDLLSHAMSLD